MSDNPSGNEDIRRLRAELDLDVGGFDAGAEKAEQSILRLAHTAEEASQEATSSFANLNRAMQDMQNMHDFGALRAELGMLQEPVKGFESEIKQATSNIKEFQEAASSVASRPVYTPGLTNAADIGYGVEGGLPGPGLPPVAADPESVGSLFGVARGLRGGAQLANMAAPGSGTGIMAGTDLLILVQGFRNLGDILPAINDNIMATGKGFPLIGEALAGLGVPMSGLLSVALPLAAAVVALGIAVAGFISTINKGNEDVKKAAEQNTEYNKLAENSTTEELEQKKVKAQQDKEALEQTMAILQQQKSGHEQALAQATKQGDFLTGTAERVGLQSIYGQIDETQKKLDQASADLDTYNKALEAQGVNANDTAEQIRAETDAQVAQQKLFYADDQLTSDAAKKKIGLLENNIATEKDAISVLEAANQVQGISSAEVKKNEEAIKQHQQAMQADQEELTHLKEVSLDLIKAREDEAQYIKDTEAAIKAENKAKEDLRKQEEQIRTQAANQVTNAISKEMAAEEQYHAGSIQDIEARREIALKEHRAEEQLAQQTADKIEDINTKLANKLVDIQTGLDRSIADDVTKFNQNYAKAVRDANDQEEDNQIDHLRRLADIQNKSQTDDQEALLDRNFLALAKNENSRQQEINQENASYQEREADLRTHLARQTRELQIKLAQDEVQDMLAAERKREDAQRNAEIEIAQQQLTEQRKRAQLQLSEHQQLLDLTTNETYKIELLRQGLQTELALYRDQENQRLLIAMRTQDEIVKHAWESIGITPSTGTPNPNRPQDMNSFATGGSFGAGEAFQMVEDGKPETLNIGMMSAQMNAAALVMPLQSGSVTPNAGKTPVQMFNEWNIHESANPEATINLAISKMEQMLEGLIN